MSLKHLAFDDSGVLAFGGLTDTYQTILALSDDADVLWIFNQTDAPILLSIPSGYSGSKNIRLPASSAMSIDCRSNSKRLAKGLVQVKYASGAPTSGEVVVTVAR